MVYTMLQLDGKDVGALFKMPEEMTSQGIPPNWLSYVSVKSADETADKAKSLGGTLMKEPFDVMDVGRMSYNSGSDGSCLRNLAGWDASGSGNLQRSQFVLLE